LISSSYIINRIINHFVSGASIH